MCPPVLPSRSMWLTRWTLSKTTLATAQSVDQISNNLPLQINLNHMVGNKWRNLIISNSNQCKRAMQAVIKQYQTRSWKEAISNWTSLRILGLKPTAPWFLNKILKGCCKKIGLNIKRQSLTLSWRKSKKRKQPIKYKSSMSKFPLWRNSQSVKTNMWGLLILLLTRMSKTS